MSLWSDGHVYHVHSHGEAWEKALTKRAKAWVFSGSRTNSPGSRELTRYWMDSKALEGGQASSLGEGAKIQDPALSPAFEET